MCFEHCSEADDVLDREGWEQGPGAGGELGLFSDHQGSSILSYSHKGLGHRRHIELNFGQFVSAPEASLSALAMLLPLSLWQEGV
jgi:hypothetical protein